MKIKERRIWSANDIITMCRKNNLFNLGDLEEYDHTVSLTDILEPTDENIYLVAKRIVEKSEDQTVENVMYLIANQAVYRTFEIEE